MESTRRISRMNMDDHLRNIGFGYVIDKSKQSPICFGSTISREVLPRSGSALTPFMRRMGATKGTNIGPSFYNGDNKGKMVSIGRSPRWQPDKSYNPPIRPPVKPKLPKSAPAPFNQSSMRDMSVVLNAYPGPGTYNPSNEKLKMKYNHSFGGRKTIVPAVDVKCVPYNDDVCSICGTGCSQQGDYWHKDNKFFICRFCFEKLYLSKKRHKKYEPSEFKPIRDCFFAHHHELFENSIKLLSYQQIRKKIYKEAYLGQYFSHIMEKKYT